MNIKKEGERKKNFVPLNLDSFILSVNVHLDELKENKINERKGTKYLSQESYASTTHVSIKLLKLIRHKSTNM